MTVNLLSEEEIKSKLQSLSGWELKPITSQGKTVTAITKKFKQMDFVASMGFVTKTALLSETADHHPTITINYAQVTLTLFTHSAGGLTEKDFQLAQQIEMYHPDS